MISRILDVSIRRRWLVVLFAVMATAFGGWSLTRLPIDAVPDITNNQVQINVVAPALSPDQIEKQVAFTVETALAGIPGLTGILTANPYYNKPSQEGQYQHFKAIADSVDLPILLYNIPGRTAANLEPATVLRLSELKNVVGIKESSGSVVQITDLIGRMKAAGLSRFCVLAGDDAMALPVIAIGGVGLISVASNAVPAEYARMVRAALAGEWDCAREINLRFFRLSQAHFTEPSPAPVKAVLALRGKGADHLRLPMTPVSDGLRERLAALVDELQLGSSRR